VVKNPVDTKRKGNGWKGEKGKQRLSSLSCRMTGKTAGKTFKKKE